MPLRLGFADSDDDCYLGPNEANLNDKGGGYEIYLAWLATVASPPVTGKDSGST